MTSSAGIFILSDRKAKILTALKASLHAAEQASDAAQQDTDDIAGQITSEIFRDQYNEIESIIGDTFGIDTAIVLYDDYVAILYEDADYDTIIAQAVQYSEVFGKPAFFTLTPDSDTIIFGAADGGKIRARLVLSEYPDEYDIEPEKINMDYLSFIFNAKNLTDLNDCNSAQDVIYALEEDYGIFADITPTTVPLFDTYKLLEKSKTFSVYSVL